eukprot:1537312-Rhodomonas_salina.3
MCAGGQCKFLFAPHFAGTFQSVERPLTQGVIPPSPSVFARMRPRSSGFPPTQQLQKPPTPSLRPMSQGSQRPPPSRGSSRGGLRMDGGGSGEGMSSHHLMSMTGQSENVDVQRLGTPQQRGGTPLTKPRGRGGDAEAAQVFVLRDSGLEVKELEITVRGRELVVRWDPPPTLSFSLSLSLSSMSSAAAAAASAAACLESCWLSLADADGGWCVVAWGAQATEHRVRARVSAARACRHRANLRQVQERRARNPTPRQGTLSQGVLRCPGSSRLPFSQFCWPGDADVDGGVWCVVAQIRERDMARRVEEVRAVPPQPA